MDHPPQLSGVGAESSSNGRHNWTDWAAEQRLNDLTGYWNYVKIFLEFLVW